MLNPLVRMIHKAMDEQLNASALFYHCLPNFLERKVFKFNILTQSFSLKLTIAKPPLFNVLKLHKTLNLIPPKLLKPFLFSAPQIPLKNSLLKPPKAMLSEI